jgi:hypothetical protein
MKRSEKAKAKFREIDGAILWEMLKDANEALRSAHAIAKREGKGTNWETWIKRLDTILGVQHIVLYPRESGQRQRKGKG